jgi:hypothetical protein
MTTLDRFGLAQWIGGEPTLRMLQVPELKRAMGLHGLRDDDHLADSINSMDLENRLGDVQTDCRDCLHGKLL